ncbi:MAG TPA: hypothetical protein VK550_08800 [Polyangiaceae bacterium]|nr:hypothetical protein [Polyangiaceae bacterium]
MRPRAGGRGLLLAVALITTSSAAFAAPPYPEPLGERDLETLGRREAARVAAGRIEVAVSASADLGSRHFQYSDSVGPLPVAYRLPIAPMASFGLETYPFAGSNVPVLRDLGFRGRISQGFAFNSQTPEGVKIETSWTRFGGEVRERIFVPGPHALEIGIFVGADASYFGMETATPLPALLPAARTTAVRLGFDGRLFVAGRLSLLFGAAYLVTTSPGEIYDRFRSPSVFGVDGELGAAFVIVPGLEGRLMGRYTRYVASFKPNIGDRIVAGGALDEQLQFGLGVRYAH